MFAGQPTHCRVTDEGVQLVRGEAMMFLFFELSMGGELLGFAESDPDQPLGPVNFLATDRLVSLNWEASDHDIDFLTLREV